MMGMRMPETCWAVFKWQVINLRICCIWLVDSVKSMMTHGLANPKIMLQYLHSSVTALSTYWQEYELNFVKGWESLLGYDTLSLGVWFLVFQRWLVQEFAMKQVQQLLCLDLCCVGMMRCAEGSHFMTCNLCWSLKQHFVNRWFLSEEVEMSAHEWFWMQEPNLYLDRVFKLVSRWDKCASVFENWGKK